MSAALVDPHLPLPAAPAEHWSAQLPFTVTVVIPAFNEAASIARVVARVREMLPSAEIMVVDDCSHDETAQTAAAAGARVERHPINRGNGAAVKTGIRRARGEVILLMDADGQMDPRFIPTILGKLAEGFDMVVGARSRQTQGDNIARRLGNRALDALGSYLVEAPVRDLTSGYRAMRRSVIMEFIHLLPNRYSYPTTSTLALTRGGYSVGFVEIEGQQRRSGKSGQKLLRNGVRFGLIILRIVSLFAPLRVYFPVAISMLLLGILAFFIGYLFGPEPFRLRVPGSSVFLLTGSLIVFMFGLLAEQIAALRFDRSGQISDSVREQGKL